MDNKQNNLLDDKFEVAGRWPSSQHQETAINNRRKTIGIILFTAIILLLLILVFILLKLNQPRPVSMPSIDVNDSITTPIVRPALDPLGTATIEKSCVEKLDTVINDVRLSVYIPHNATAELTIGVPNINDNDIILAAQAADVRADNGKIVGAFVYKGEPKAWGLSKKGYCAIIGNDVTVGVSDNSPLFEEATEKGGYFFRQYPLVDNGTLVENEPKNKTMRKALCSRSGQTLMVVSESDESFHDFAQALVDLGVDNAVYLVGSHTSYGWYQNESGVTEEFAPNNARKKYKNETYIVWRSSK